MFGTSPIAGLFGRSPFRPTQEHMAVVERCSAELVPLVAALLAGEPEQMLAHKQRIDELEHRADEIKNEIRSHLPRSLFMPIDRRDLLDLLHAQDSIADTVQDVAGLLCLRRLETPPSFRELLSAFARRSHDAVVQCQEIIGLLDELLEMGFRGREVDEVEAKIRALSAIESETDTQGAELTRLLFEQGDGMSPPTFFLWYELFQKLGDVADYAEDVGDRLRLLVAR
ncbi:MAG: TIGR00153 family protein [Thermoanaerobaculia bacterium]|nr:TIGR00153 family protein [Thermoanaerobaculia bacterium]